MGDTQGSPLKFEGWGAGKVQFDGDCFVFHHTPQSPELIEHGGQCFGEPVIVGSTFG